MKKRLLSSCIILLAVFIVGFGLENRGEAAQALPASIWVVSLQDTVNTGTAEYLGESLRAAAGQNASLVVITLNTPGGLVESMRQMVQDIMNSTVPVVVYVSPAGAHAASAGAFIMLAAHVSAMAPGTNVGAAHPVTGSGANVEGDMAEKITNDLAALAASLAKARGRDQALAVSLVKESKSLDAEEAKEKGLCDIVANNLGDLISQLEGREVLLTNGSKVVISGQGQSVYYHEPNFRDRLLSLLASPSLAYILFMIGLAGLYFEFTNPGAIFPGVIGGICLVVALFAMSALSVSASGLLLVGLALLFFILELKFSSHGLLSLAGVACLFLGSFMLFNDAELGPGLSWKIMLPTLLLISGFFFVTALLAGRAQVRKSVTGQSTVLGAEALVIGPGQVRVRGEIWKADTSDLNPGDIAKVVKVDGLDLTLDNK